MKHIPHSETRSPGGVGNAYRHYNRPRNPALGGAHAYVRYGIQVTWRLVGVGVGWNVS